jgi:beta-lactam-binding protein with PASTA domain
VRLGDAIVKAMRALRDLVWVLKSPKQSKILEPSQDSISSHDATLQDHGRRICEVFSPAQA